MVNERKTAYNHKMAKKQFNLTADVAPGTQIKTKKLIVSQDIENLDLSGTEIEFDSAIFNGSLINAIFLVWFSAETKTVQSDLLCEKFGNNFVGTDIIVDGQTYKVEAFLRAKGEGEAVKITVPKLELKVQPKKTLFDKLNEFNFPAFLQSEAIPESVTITSESEIAGTVVKAKKIIFEGEIVDLDLRGTKFECEDFELSGKLVNAKFKLVHNKTFGRLKTDLFDERFGDNFIGVDVTIGEETHKIDVFKMGPSDSEEVEVVVPSMELKVCAKHTIVDMITKKADTVIKRDVAASIIDTVSDVVTDILPTVVMDKEYDIEKDLREITDKINALIPEDVISQEEVKQILIKKKSPVPLYLLHFRRKKSAISVPESDDVIYSLFSMAYRIMLYLKKTDGQSRTSITEACAFEKQDPTTMASRCAEMFEGAEDSKLTTLAKQLFMIGNMLAPTSFEKTTDIMVDDSVPLFGKRAKKIVDMAAALFEEQYGGLILLHDYNSGKVDQVKKFYGVKDPFKLYTMIHTVRDVAAAVIAGVPLNIIRKMCVTDYMLATMEMVFDGLSSIKRNIVTASGDYEGPVPNEPVLLVTQGVNRCLTRHIDVSKSMRVSGMSSHIVVGDIKDVSEGIIVDQGLFKLVEKPIYEVEHLDISDVKSVAVKNGQLITSQEAHLEYDVVGKRTIVFKEHVVDFVHDDGVPKSYVMVPHLACTKMMLDGTVMFDGLVVPTGNVTIIVRDLKRNISAYDYLNDVLYVAEDSTIYNGRKAVHQMDNVIVDMFYDPIGLSLYVVDDLGIITRILDSGKRYKVYVASGHISSITIDIINRILYFVEDGSVSKIALNKY